MDLLPGVRSATTDTDRIRMHHLESGPVDAPVIVMVHGNLSTGRFFEHLMPELPAYRVIAPDMRGFGDSEDVALDATRGLDDWTDDLFALLDALRIGTPVHLVGWSTAAVAIARYAMARPVASLTFIGRSPRTATAAPTPTARPAIPTSPAPAAAASTRRWCGACARATRATGARSRSATS